MGTDDNAAAPLHRCMYVFFSDDFNRVVLEEKENNATSDYINASHIKVIIYIVRSTLKFVEQDLEYIIWKIHLPPQLLPNSSGM